MTEESVDEDGCIICPKCNGTGRGHEDDEPNDGKNSMNFKISIQNYDNGWVVDAYRQDDSRFCPERNVFIFKTVQELAAALPELLEPPKPVNNPDGAM